MASRKKIFSTRYRFRGQGTKFLALVVSLLLAVAHRTAASEVPATRWTPERLVNGSPFLVRVTPTGPWKSLSGVFEGRKVFFDREASSGEWVGFAGVGYDAPAGRDDLALRAILESGAEEAFTITVPIARISRPKSELRVPMKFVQPNARTRVRIKREQAIKADLLSRITPRRLFEARFTRPVKVETSEGYGVERVFNGKSQSVHFGLDYRAPVGTPVTAVAGGRIVLARDFFYEGRFVVIDHGYGLMTLYLHLSWIGVSEGDEVTAGQRLGLSGASGRATGPHLHLAVRWQSLYLDPVTLLELAPRRATDGRESLRWPAFVDVYRTFLMTPGSELLATLNHPLVLRASVGIS